MDMNQQRTETIRWYALLAIYNGRPYPVAEPLILSTIQSIPIQCSALELRRELDYLRDRDLLVLDELEGAPWTANITRHGVDLVEYKIDVQPGIARPKKYWQG